MRVSPAVAVGDHVTLSWAPSCGRCDECVRDATAALPGGVAGDGRRRAARRNDAGSHATASRSIHYSLISSFAEACVVPERSCVVIPKRRPVRHRRARRVRDHDRDRRGLEHGEGPARRSRRRRRLWRGRAVGAARRGGRRGGRDRRPSTSRRRSSRSPRSSARRRASSGPARRRRRPRRCAQASGGGVDYAIEATGPARGDARGVPLDPQPRRRGADRDPARGRRARAAARSRFRGWSAASSARSTARPDPSETSSRSSISTVAAGCRSTVSISHRLPLDRIDEAFALMHAGEARRAVLDLDGEAT